MQRVFVIRANAELFEACPSAESIFYEYVY